MLKGSVQKFALNNYTWLFPLVPTWGSIEIQLDLETPDGRSLWGRTFSGRGFTFNFTDGYTIVTKEAMTIILNDMVRELSSNEFYGVFAQAHATGQ